MKNNLCLEVFQSKNLYCDEVYQELQTSVATAYIGG